MNIMATIVGIVILIMAMSAMAKPGNPKDMSDPELVRKYIAMPCDGLDSLYAFLYQELVHLTSHYKACLNAANNQPDVEYGHLMCYYVKLEWDLMFSHAESVEKAWNLMCNDWGERKHPEYNIDF